ncbi:MAG TPA: hypothetical protein VF813_01600 [Anaerolineaceae bacterium]
MKTVDPQLSALNRWQWTALIVGAACALLAVVSGLLGGLSQFFQAYLVAFLFWIGLSLGSLAILMLHFVGGGRWASLIRRILEAATKTIWLMAILFIPLLFGTGYLYPWTDPAQIAADAVLKYKSAFLNMPLFVVVSVVIFAIWFLLVFLLARWSKQEEAGDLRARVRENRLSAPGLILFFLTVTAAAFYWIMSIFPTWSSSVFGLLIAMSQVLASMGFALFVLPGMPGFRPSEVDARGMLPKLFRDLGALELTFVVLWAYLSFFQLLIIWAGNIPHEVDWYVTRTQGGWMVVGMLLALVQVALPFLALIPMRVRSNPSLLRLIGLVLLVINWVNYFWIVIPEYYPAFHLSLSDILLPMAIGGLWLGLFFNRLKSRPLQAFWDMPMETEQAPEVRP